MKKRFSRNGAAGIQATKKANLTARLFQESLAEWTGLEPATLGVTGRYSNQLNYHSALMRIQA